MDKNSILWLIYISISLMIIILLNEIINSHQEFTTDWKHKHLYRITRKIYLHLLKSFCLLYFVIFFYLFRIDVRSVLSFSFFSLSLALFSHFFSRTYRNILLTRWRKWEPTLNYMSKGCSHAFVNMRDINDGEVVFVVFARHHHHYQICT